MTKRGIAWGLSYKIAEDNRVPIPPSISSTVRCWTCDQKPIYHYHITSEEEFTVVHFDFGIGVSQGPFYLNAVGPIYVYPTSVALPLVIKMRQKAVSAGEILPLNKLGCQVIRNQAYSISSAGITIPGCYAIQQDFPSLPLSQVAARSCYETITGYYFVWKWERIFVARPTYHILPCTPPQTRLDGWLFYQLDSLTATTVEGGRLRMRANKRPSSIPNAVEKILGANADIRAASCILNDYPITDWQVYVAQSPRKDTRAWCNVAIKPTGVFVENNE